MTQRRIKTDREYEIEKHWRERLLANPTTEEFQRAYDELHAWFLDQQGGAGDIYAQVNPRGMDRSRLALLREIGARKRVLEVGCGDGVTSHLLAKQGNSVVSIDVPKIALDRARAKHGREELDLRYEYGDARDLQFPDESFDYVISEHLVEHLSPADFSRHLGEVQRVLKVGACYVFFMAWPTVGRIPSPRVCAGGDMPDSPAARFPRNLAASLGIRHRTTPSPVAAHFRLQARARSNESAQMA